MKKYEKDISKIGRLLNNKFQKDLLYASFINLAEESNPLCFNNFAYSMRELARHMLDSLAPDEKIVECAWYDIKEAHEGKPTRKQKIKYAIQGVLKDSFIDSKILSLHEIKEHQKDIVDSINLLSKYTHINEATYNIPEKEKEEKANQVITSFVAFAELIQECRNTIINRTEEFIDFNIYEAAIYEVIDVIDIMSTHHNIETVHVESTSLQSIEEDLITFDIQGNLNVRLQWGSDGDMRRGDGHETYENFTFTCVASVKLDIYDYSNISISKIEVDTDEYWGITEEEIEKYIREAEKQMDDSLDSL